MIFKKEEINKIIIIDFGGIGDVILAIPFLRGLRKYFSNSKIDFLCVERSFDIINKNRYLDNVYNVKLKPVDLFKKAMELRNEKYDIGINLMPVTSYIGAFKIFVFLFLLKVNKWIGRDTKGLGFFYNIKIPEEQIQTENEVLMYGKILKSLTSEGIDETLELDIKTGDIAAASELINKIRKNKDSKIILVNPGADWPAKRWFIDRYIELVNRILSEYAGIEIGIIGIQNEIKLAEAIKQKCGDKVFILSGKTSLKILPAVIKESELLITNDSGSSHIARAVGTPSVVLAGPSQTGYLSIKGNAESAVIYKPVNCAPCIKYECDSMKCWQDITVDEVFKAVKTIWEKR